MKGRTMHCPHCGGKFQIPGDIAGKMVCPFCAKPMEADMPSDASASLGKAAGLLPPEAFSTMIEVNQLNAKHYADVFETYRGAVLPALHAYLQEEADYGDQAAELFASALFDGFEREERAARRNSMRTFDLRISITSLLIPAILDLNVPAADRLADLFLQKWNAVHKKPLGKAKVADIQDGFRKKLCFITTAVCTELGKGDDCEELQALRLYRDGYLSQIPEGKRKIEEYYLFAPLIVQSVETSGNAKAEWNRIYREYLFPCLSALKHHRPEECGKRYETMMCELEQKWL
ncbi:MAG: hypothetical protein LKJ17_03590 [Oscillospiraceae bacterium]|jgi:hypothetical protein|nr:hypothetical protein [Oscillospiraceae bacterium]